MVIEETYRRAAAELHKEYPAVDAHLDLAGELLFRVQNKEENPLRGRYLEHLRAGGFRLIVSSVYLRDSELPEAGLRNALDQISVLLDEVEKNREFCMVRTREDMERALEEDRIGILLYDLEPEKRPCQRLLQGGRAGTDPGRPVAGGNPGGGGDGAAGHVSGREPSE